MQYYDTIRPHTHPWEMLGFTIKPSWWVSQYGADFGSGNALLWSDLEQGIIRQGDDENVIDNTYILSTNLFRRIGLASVLPIDAQAQLRDPVAIGMVSTNPNIALRNAEWKTGDIGPAEYAFRASSVYPYVVSKL